MIRTTTVAGVHHVEVDRIDVHRSDCRDVERALAEGRRTGDRIELLGYYTVEQDDPEQVLRDQLVEDADPDDLGYRDNLRVRYLPCCG